MCISFEEISKKKNRGDKGLLKGLCKMYLDAKQNVAIISVPVELMEIDTRYQTEVRTNRDLRYLTNNWDENKLLPLTGVPHWEEGKIYLVDGYARWVGSQIVDKDKYKDLLLLVILNAPKNPEERLRFEAELFAYQNAQVSRLTAIQKHGAMLVMHDEATETLERMKHIYGFDYIAEKGSREASILGSYTEILALCKIDHGKAAEYVFDVCRDAGFDRKPNGYASYVIRALRDMYKLYANSRAETKQFLTKLLRGITPLHLKANAVTKYPMLESRTATTLYVEDLVVENLRLHQAREIQGTKLIPIQEHTA